MVIPRALQVGRGVADSECHVGVLGLCAAFPLADALRAGDATAVELQDNAAVWAVCFFHVGFIGNMPCHELKIDWQRI